MFEILNKVLFFTFEIYKVETINHLSTAPNYISQEILHINQTTLMINLCFSELLQHNMSSLIKTESKVRVTQRQNASVHRFPSWLMHFESAVLSMELIYILPKIL